jgi:hypothetical protein
LGRDHDDLHRLRWPQRSKSTPLAGLQGAENGHGCGMTEMPEETDPSIGAHVVAIRNRFGLGGLREAARLIEVEIAIFDETYDEMPTA